jgi:trehalose/maltose hydrolase-like predicted phosphorylase
VDDNAFTNVMARWNIRCALELVGMLRERWPEPWAHLASRIALDDSELADWLAVAETLVTGFDSRTKLFEQFAGFFSLEEIDLDQFADRRLPMDVVLGRKRTQGSQVIKQADIVALLALLPEEFDRATMIENFRFYEPRCGHGSSLSRGMHALVAARLGETELALRYFRLSAAIDLSPAFDPQLPPDWRSLQFKLQWRHRRFKVRIGSDGFVAKLEFGEPLTLLVRDQPHVLGCGHELRIEPS